MSVNDKILDKIKNLLTLAEDGNNDEESQTALLMAQKLMLKYKISQNDLSSRGKQEIVIRSLSVYKRIFWWEKVLVKIIADNFRVMFYIQSHRLPYQKNVGRKLVLMGYPEDVDLAYEMFYLAEDAMKFYASQYINGQVRPKTASQKSRLRKTYYQGFLDGLKDKFEKQKADLIKENEKFALVIQTPQEIKDKFKEEITGSLSFNQPDSYKNKSYYDGYKHGTRMNLNNNYLDHVGQTDD
ncbi:DUF2786 domain-containing protein [Eremococcus coleocola]|uniref:DUF2786 domain-containing protein n=1 Tax=Eremococcus coleocola TaxID=88132 RepID=UPI000415AA5C|nr:DUF2786 domain-containing protein [Eremococcus coleocola]